MASMTAGRYVLLCCTYEDGMPEPKWSYVTSWDTWEEAKSAAFPIPPGFKLRDDETEQEWRA